MKVLKPKALTVQFLVGLYSVATAGVSAILYNGASFFADRTPAGSPVSFHM